MISVIKLIKMKSVIKSVIERELVRERERVEDRLACPLYLLD